MKNKFILLSAVCGLALLATGAAYYGQSVMAVAPLIDNTTTTNLTYNTAAYPAHPWIIPSGGVFSNYVAFSTVGFREVSLQFCCQGTNTTITSNVVWQVRKAVNGFSPTNFAGTGVTSDLVGYATNVLNGATRVSTTMVLTPGPQLAQGPANVGPTYGIGGATSIYVSQVDMRNCDAGITNVQVYVHGQ